MEVEPIPESVMQKRTSQIEEQNFVPNCAIPHMKGKKMEDKFSKSARSVGYKERENEPEECRGFRVLEREKKQKPDGYPSGSPF